MKYGHTLRKERKCYNNSIQVKSHLQQQVIKYKHTPVAPHAHIINLPYTTKIRAIISSSRQSDRLPTTQQKVRYQLHVGKSILANKSSSNNIGIV